MYSMGPDTGRQRASLLHLSWERAHQATRVSLRFAKGHKSTVTTDFGVTNKF